MWPWVLAVQARWCGCGWWGSGQVGDVAVTLEGRCAVAMGRGGLWHRGRGQQQGLFAPRYAMKCLDKKRIKMKQGETLALNERIMLSLVSTGVRGGRRRAGLAPWLQAVAWERDGEGGCSRGTSGTA